MAELEVETDNIMADVLAAQAEIAGEKPAEDVAGAAGSEGDVTTHEPAATDGRERDEYGRFKAKEGEAEGEKRPTLTLKEKAPTEGAKAPTDGVQAQTGSVDQPKDGPQAIPAPVGWNGAGKVQWERLPPGVKENIAADYRKTEEVRQQYAPIEQAIAPHRETWMRDAGSIEGAINQLGAFYRAYLDNPIGLIQHIVRTRGIDLGAAQGQAPAQGATPQAPDINSIIEQRLQQKLAPIEQRFAQAETQQVTQTIDAFRQDPKHPYFEDVRVQMGYLISTAEKMGQKLTLQDAYDQATWAHPAIRTQLLAAQTEEAKRNQAADADKARKAASASLRGSPLPNPSGAVSQTSSVLDDVRAAASEIAGA